jgi:hypothetical protein
MEKSVELFLSRNSMSTKVRDRQGKVDPLQNMLQGLLLELYSQPLEAYLQNDGSS